MGMSNPGGATFVACWVGMCVGYGTWIILWPEHYRKSWKKYLKNGDPFERMFPGRTASLSGMDLKGRNPNRRARMLGFVFVGVGVAVGVGFLLAMSRQ
jgi:hypothetical protein